MTPPIRILCVICQDEIKSKPHILCAVCANYHICVSCFSVGGEIGSHKSDHDYHVIPQDHFGVFLAPENTDAKITTPRRSDAKPWKAWEEIRLLKAMEQFQYGNWKDVVAMLKARTAETCEEHYVHCYINGNLGEVTWGRLNQDTAHAAHLAARGIIDHTLPAQNSTTGFIVMDECDMTSQPSPNVTAEEAMKVGFLLRRQDFEVEHDNDAEKLISDIEFDRSDDDYLERQLKYLKIDAYYRRLVERNSRKRVALEYKLLEGFFTKVLAKTTVTSGYPLKRKWHSREAEIGKKLKPFSRLLNVKLMDILRPCLLQEEILRARLHELIRYKSLGFRTFNECHSHENEKLHPARKRSASVSEAGPSGVTPAKNSKIPASASKADRFATLKEREAEHSHRLNPRRHSRNISSALSAKP